ncbi:hypothetical protein HD554DRAFT_2120054 [Boletus coccyginus]|nr:hypothetical protein HD554DRAFT_2120054 [Boletus coccyginus]
MPTAIKLQTFCKIAGKAGYRWAWSDTSCIDQKNLKSLSTPCSDGTITLLSLLFTFGTCRLRRYLED